MQGNDVREILHVTDKTLRDFNPTELLSAVQARWAGAELAPSALVARQIFTDLPVRSLLSLPLLTCTTGKAMATHLGEIKANTR